MTCAHFVLSLICLISIAQETHQSLSSFVHQKTRLISVNVGDNVTLQCFYRVETISTTFFWYKQSLRQQPKMISTYDLYDRKGTFHEDFKDNKRFTLKNENYSLILIISDVQVSDSATYYCAKSMHGFSFEFSEGTTVFVKDANSLSKALVQQSETIHPGNSVTLKCTASTESCDREPSVYWFKNSEDHHPSLIYTQSDKNVSQCERKTSKTHTCVYNLPLNNLNQSNAGTYYCAVTVCGRIVFGNGTRLELKDGSNYSVLVYVLGGALLVTSIILIILIILMCKMLKANSSWSTALPATATEGINESSDDLIYANPIISPFTRSQTRRQEECVYSRVKT